MTAKHLPYALMFSQLNTILADTWYALFQCSQCLIFRQEASYSTIQDLYQTATRKQTPASTAFESDAAVAVI